MKIALLSQDEKLNQTLMRMFNEYSSRRLIPIETITYHSNKNFLNSPSKFDILFVDENSNPLSFRDTLRMCRGIYKDDCIVIISSTQEHMSEAFEFQIHRFILKPLSEGTVYESLDSCRRDKFASKSTVVKTASGFKSLKMENIVFVEAERKVATVHTDHGIVQTYTPFSDVLEQLPSEYFFTCHRSIIINMDFVEEFNSTEIKMRQGDIVPLSRRRKLDFCIDYNKYVKSHSIS